MTTSNFDLLSQVISFLHTAFAIRDLDKPSFFLGLQVQYIGVAMHLVSQLKYIQDLLERTHLEDSKPTLGCSGWSISQIDGTPLHNPTEYISIVGTLQYATLTRPDIAFVINKACHFMAQPTNVHWTVVKRILRYLQGSLHHGLLFQSSSFLQLQGYSDADWASYPGILCLPRNQSHIMVIHQATNCLQKQCRI